MIVALVLQRLRGHPRIRMATQDKTKLEEMMEMFMKIREQDKTDDKERRELEKREYEER